MRARFLAAAAMLAAFLCIPQSAARAAEIRVLSAVALKPALDELSRDFERQSGHTVVMSYATGGAVRDRIRGGEAVDLAIAPKAAFDALLAQGNIARDRSSVVARSLVAVAVPAGSPRPDISTVPALRQSLLATRSIVYPDPAQGGATGIHAARVIERLGITEQLKSRTLLVPGSEYADVLARREAELAIVQPMVVLGVAGVDVVGPLPAELQNPADFTFWGGVSADAKQPAAAAAFLQYLQTPDAARAIKAKGMEPGAE